MTQYDSVPTAFSSSTMAECVALAGTAFRVTVAPVSAWRVLGKGAVPSVVMRHPV